MSIQKLQIYFTFFHYSLSTRPLQKYCRGSKKRLHGLRPNSCSRRCGRIGAFAPWAHGFLPQALHHHAGRGTSPSKNFLSSALMCPSQPGHLFSPAYPRHNKCGVTRDAPTIKKPVPEDIVVRSPSTAHSQSFQALIEHCVQEKDIG